MTITKSGELASFYTVNKAHIKHLKVCFSPKQAGTGDPSPNNVREISGWNGYTFYKTGKNLFPIVTDETTRTSAGITETVNLDGSLTFSGTCSSTFWGIDCRYFYLKPGKYRISQKNAPTGLSLNIYYRDMLTNTSTWKESIDGTGEKNFTVATEGFYGYYHRIDKGIVTNCTVTIQMELANIATEYEPYRGQTYTLDWTSEVGTVYGGYVDLVTGELVETHAIKRIVGNEDWYMISGINDFCAYRPTLRNITFASNGYIAPTCNKLSGVAQWGTKINACTINENGNFYFGAPEELSTSEAVNNWIQSIGGFEFTYPISPITHQLSPTQLSTLIGRNNIWSNADRVEVEYDLAESNDELYRRRNILMRSAPHIETASGNIAHFETDIAAPIKSAKISFSPVQEGSGDPSPTNVRPISGFTNLSLYHSGENLYVPNSNNKGYISKSGVITVDETSTYTDLIPVNLGEVYSFECTTVSVNGDTNRRIHGYNSSGTWVQQLASGTTAANVIEDRKIFATIPSGISYIRVSFRNQDTDVRIAKENIVTANWQTAAGTIYGGYVDLITGNVYQTWQKIKITDKIWYNFSTETYYYINIRPSDNSIYDREPNSYIYSDTLTPRTDGNFLHGNVGEFTYYGPESSYLSNYNYVWTKLPEPMKQTEANTWIQETYPNAYFYYKLATPILVTTLTSTQFTSLKGTNNIWSNAGPVEIKYWTH